MDQRREITYLPIESIRPSEWNPNTQTDAVFNALCENIREIGMVEPVMVKPEEDGTYVLISGEHRYEACKVLGYKEIPAFVMEDFDVDKAKFQTVRMNMLKGKLDPVRFTQLFDEMADKYGHELTKQMMGFVDEKAFEDLYISVRKELPKELQKQLDAAKDEIKNVDDLATILNELFSKYGDTLKHNFMVFTYGGKTHLWVLMTAKLRDKLLYEVVEEITGSGLDISVFFEKLLDYSDEVINDMIASGVGMVEDTQIDF